MSIKPDENDLIAYLYGELEEEDRLRVEQYLNENPEAARQLLSLRELRATLSAVEDKEVIAPPIVVGNTADHRFNWNAPYLRTILGIAASLLLIILVGKALDTRINLSTNGLTISFGEKQVAIPVNEPVKENALSTEEVRRMIDSALKENNAQVQFTLEASNRKLQASIRENLDANSGRVDERIRQVAMASQEQVQQYVAALQAQNSEMVKEYFRVSSVEQKDYIEAILVDFSKYVQQQRINDLQMVQTQLSAIQQNTDLFKQETEQILSSIITDVGAPRGIESRN